MLGFAATALFVFALLLEHLVEPDLVPASHMISEYAQRPGGALMTVGFLGWSIGLTATAAWIYLSPLGSRARRPLSLFVALASLGMLVTALWKTQTSAGQLPPGVVLTVGGRLHDLGSGVTSLALLAAAALCAASPRVAPALRIASACAVVVAFAVSAALLPIGRSVGGARQRALVGTAVGWQLYLLTRNHLERA